ncbi:MAG: restriction endonuclease subunit R, partial [bacterium]|nr:restriction endonuclease subunit R [bacterium]
KKVFSRTKFEQMIGRGTRLCPELFGPGKENNKKYFLIHDFCGNFEFFDKQPDGMTPSVSAPLSQKILKKRLLLTRTLYSPDYKDDAEAKQLAAKTAGIIENDIHRLDLDSFVVRPKRKQVEKFSHIQSWELLSVTDYSDMEKELAPIILPQGKEETARRFDNLLLEMQLSVVEKNTAKDSHLKRLKDLVRPLLKKGNVPAVKKRMPLIEEILTDGFAAEVTLLKLEEVREEIRDLIRFIDRNDVRLVFTDFLDTLGEAEEVDGLIDDGTRYESYRAKVETYIRENSHHITIEKLKTNRPITEMELQELERILLSQCDMRDVEKFRTAVGIEKPLGTFIRSVVGLDMKALKDAFGEYLENSTYSADQIHFINYILDYFHTNGCLEIGNLFSSPFTDIHGDGLYGLFDVEETSGIIGKIKGINKNAEAVGF